jgi:hypothetical protein
MNDDLLLDLMRTMANRGFRQVLGTAAISDAMLLLKRQTWNANRAIVIVCPAQIPTDICDYLRFAFVARQQRISTETQDFYIDLVLQLIQLLTNLRFSSLELAENRADFL